ncbi:unnamed protein product [Zymoseptoria tritici ST99CH_1A5]|uniref:Uncharacterized protein n=1 Tax=Zymoseptoria tritici ST99CH_1A5 TaxID=1276529 RepID=A0A1Y6LHP6_ZYMTR|nr:unnamed protein product [Zymoseptoria tritici ST99CH_1A5]
MCYQGFAHFRCHHSTSFVELCEDALALDLPFFLAISCPSYSMSSHNPALLCGDGRYYCAQCPDGPFLDRLHALQWAAAENLAENKANVEGLKTMAKKMVDDEVLQGREANEVKRSEPFREIVAAVDFGMTEGKELDARRTRLNAAADTARKWVFSLGNRIIGHEMEIALPYHLRRWVDNVMEGRVEPSANMYPGAALAAPLGAPASTQLPAPRAQFQSRPPITPSGVPATVPYAVPSAFTGHLPPVARAPFTVPGQFAAPAPAGVPHNIQYHGHSLRPTQVQDEDNIVVKHTERPNRTSSVVQGSSAQKSRRPPIKREETQDSVLSEYDSPTSNRKQAKKKVKQEAPPPKEESSSVRRSARTRGKRISYAEQSDPISRTPSPEKSDHSSFSPQKSDFSERSVQDRRKSAMNPSPLKNEMSASHSSNSLVDKIAEWSRRGGGVPAKTPTPVHAVPQSGHTMQANANAPGTNFTLPPPPDYPSNRRSGCPSNFATVAPGDFISMGNANHQSGYGDSKPTPDQQLAAPFSTMQHMDPVITQGQHSRIYGTNTGLPTQYQQQSYAQTSAQASASSYSRSDPRIFSSAQTKSRPPQHPQAMEEMRRRKEARVQQGEVPNINDGSSQSVPTRTFHVQASTNDPFTTFSPERMAKMIFAEGTVALPRPGGEHGMAAALQNLKATPSPIKRSLPSFTSTSGQTPPSSKRARLSSNFAPNQDGDPFKADDGGTLGPSRKSSVRNTPKKRTASGTPQMRTPSRAMSDASRMSGLERSGGPHESSTGKVPSSLKRDWAAQEVTVGAEYVPTPSRGSGVSTEQYQQGMSTIRGTGPLGGLIVQPNGQSQKDQSQYNRLEGVQRQVNDMHTQYGGTNPPHNGQHPTTGAQQSERTYTSLPGLSMNVDSGTMTNMVSINNTAGGQHDFGFPDDLSALGNLDWDFGEQAMGGFGHVDGG